MKMSLPSVVPLAHIEGLYTMASSTPNGAFVEVGVYKGGTASYLTHLAEIQGRKVYLYDTFEGIPFSDDGDFHVVGDFNDTSYEDVKNALPYASVVKGIFPGSAIPMESVAFAHIDCDQYRSIIESVNYLLPLMVKGGVIWFDDVDDHLPNTMKAITEMFGDKYAYSKTGKVYTVIL